jgi:HEPN domain-containing protein
VLYHLIQALRKSGRTDDIPELLKRLADLRMEGTKEEAEHNRYKLVEEKTPSSWENQENQEKQDKQDKQEKQEKPQP